MQQLFSVFCKGKLYLVRSSNLCFSIVHDRNVANWTGGHFHYNVKGLFSTLQSLSHRRNTSSLPLLQLYFHGKRTDNAHSLVLSTVTFTTKIVYVKYTGTNHSYSIHISLISSIRTASSQESLLHGTDSSDRYNLTLFKSLVNQHRFYIQSSTALLSPSLTCNKFNQYICFVSLKNIQSAIKM